MLAVIGVAWFLVLNTVHNLSQRGIATGFGFLSTEAGFGIIQHLIDYNESSTFGRVFLVGLLNTMVVSALGIVFATGLGFVVGVARLSSNWLIARLATIYIEAFRNIPLLLQIFFWYFAVLRTLPGPRQSLGAFGAVFLNVRGLYVPAPVFGEGFRFVSLAVVFAAVTAVGLISWNRRRRRRTGRHFPAVPVALGVFLGLPTGVFFLVDTPLSWDIPYLAGFNFTGGLVLIPELVALLVALSLYTAAFIAEIVRAGILAVPKGQKEAAASLGLSPGLSLRLVVIPQALRVIVPPLTSQYLNLAKNSSLAAAIGYPDLVSVFAGTTLNQTGQAVEVIAITMGVYLAISLAISGFMNWYNRRIALIGGLG